MLTEQQIDLARLFHAYHCFQVADRCFVTLENLLANTETSKEEIYRAAKACRDVIEAARHKDFLDFAGGRQHAIRS